MNFFYNFENDNYLLNNNIVTQEQYIKHRISCKPIVKNLGLNLITELDSKLEQSNIMNKLTTSVQSFHTLKTDFLENEDNFEISTNTRDL